MMRPKEEEVQYLMDKKLAEFHLHKSDLTTDELLKLREEIISEMNGDEILDGVLSDSDIFYRKLRQQNE